MKIFKVNEYADTPENRRREKIVNKRLHEINLKDPKKLIEDEIDFLDDLYRELESFDSYDRSDNYDNLTRRGRINFILDDIDRRITEFEDILKEF